MFSIKDSPDRSVSLNVVSAIVFSPDRWMRSDTSLAYMQDIVKPG
jgi:hypothetical protein